MGFPFSSGDVLTAADMNAIGSWTSFTPSWTNFTVGNATQDWKYAKVNNMLFITGITTLGSTSSMGSIPYFTFPTGTATTRTNGSASFEDTGTAERQGMCYAVDNFNRLLFGVYSVSGSIINRLNVSATVPHTWASGDRISATLVVPI